MVQGVGFRPFIYVLAHKFKINGWVENRNDGVVIHAEHHKTVLDDFIRAITDEAPLASNIFEINASETDLLPFQNFVIKKSESTSEEVTEISPDIAVCPKCLQDLKTQTHRVNYPMINCTNCGPRFTIIKSLPYDRDKTTMEPFEMCDICKKEYTDIFDRRFHAQPVACNNCGPVYRYQSKQKDTENIHEILDQTAQDIDSGKILAIKGMGGFHLACNAFDPQAVSTLRKRKVREGKPFAVMFKNIEKLQEYALLNSHEKDLLCSWRAPIVLLRIKKTFPKSLTNDINSIGAMLPYMPFHYLLFEKLKTSCIVLTSGNISDEPIIIDNDEAQLKLSSIADAMVSYNRKIYNRTDDSVSLVCNDQLRLIRRSRSFAPSPIYLDTNVEGIFAAGAELVNCFAIGKDQQAILSQHIGDLKNMETLEFYEESYHRFSELFRFKPRLVVHDLHPDYLSSRFAKELAQTTMAVQHHHAHIASVMAEYQLNQKVIGVAMDGTGLGDDGNIWGGEFFVCDRKAYQRLNHFEYLPMPGGDKAAHEAWRMGVSYLYHSFGKDFLNLEIPFVQNLDKEHTSLLIQAIDKKLNTPLSSSAGRLFDAIAAITEICTHATYHAEAPMKLESAIEPDCSESYPLHLGKPICFTPVIKGIVSDLQQGISPNKIAAKFHNTFVEVIVMECQKIRKEQNINEVALSGGTFQNRYILEKIENQLKTSGFRVYIPQKVPANDGGLALGQLVIAAEKLKSL